MSEAERHEFIITANVSDGEWDLDKLLAQYGNEELADFGLEKLLDYCEEENAKDEETASKEDFEDISIIIECPDSKYAEELFERLTQEGHKCKISTL